MILVSLWAINCLFIYLLLLLIVIKGRYLCAGYLSSAYGLEVGVSEIGEILHRSFLSLFIVNVNTLFGVCLLGDVLMTGNCHIRNKIGNYSHFL